MQQDHQRVGLAAARGRHARAVDENCHGRLGSGSRVANGSLERADDAFVTRFAPSPTGYLHLGHAFSALTAFDAARAAGGRFLLRIEDIDQGRARPEFESGDLRRPRLARSCVGDAGAPPVASTWRTTTRRCRTLIDRELVYRCFRTRREIAEAIASAPHGETEDVFRGEALPPEEEEAKLEAGEAFAWRLSLKKARAALGPAISRWCSRTRPASCAPSPRSYGDVVLARKDFADELSSRLGLGRRTARRHARDPRRGSARGGASARAVAKAARFAAAGLSAPPADHSARTASGSPSAIRPRRCGRCAKAAKHLAMCAPMLG